MSDGLLLIACALFAFRVWRFVGEDTFAPIRVPRDWYVARVGEDHWSVELVTCPWCAGSHVSFLTVWVTTWFTSVPMPVLFAGAVAALVGLMAKWEQQP